MTRLLGRVARVELLIPEMLVVPDVFADGDADGCAAKFVNTGRVAGLEISRFVENVVKRQEHFRVVEDHSPAVDQRRRVRHGFALLDLGMANVADQSGDVRQESRQPRHFLLRAANEVGPFHQVAGRISAEGELGEDDEVCAALLRRARKAKDSLEVSGEVTDGGVDLS